jgi:DNA-binding MarR family transcriptional regulator/predicted GNAT family N-acyltransferase
MDSPLIQLRSFNRSFTRQIGVLDDSFLGHGRPLALARLIFEISPAGRAVAELRDALELDAGYLSRMLRSLEEEGLVSLVDDEADRRRRIATLTEAGIIEWQKLDESSNVAAQSILEPLSDAQQQRLAAALATAEKLLTAATIRFEEIDVTSDLARSAISHYFAELDARFPGGFDGDAYFDEDAISMRPPRGHFIILRSDTRTLGCGGVINLEPGVGEVKRMWIDPSMRGAGLGRRLLRHLEDRLTAMGSKVIRLDTNSVLAEALALYESAGYREIDRYNDNPYARHWFEKSTAQL